MRTREYRVLLVFAALVGLFVSLLSWAFLEAVHGIQTFVYTDLPKDVGFNTVPKWWPLPWLALAGLLTSFAILRLPGNGGHVPADGLKAGGSPAQPRDLPGILLAAFATLGLGLVLGPEAPLIALGGGLGALAIRSLRKDAPDQAVALLAAAGSFAAIASIFGSPVIGAVVIIEAAGLGGAMLPVVLLPGLLAAGVGSLVFVGAGSWTGLNTSAYALNAFPLPPNPGPGWGDFGWTILVAIAGAVLVFVVVELGRWSKRVVDTHPWILRIAAALVVGGLAIAFAQATGKSVEAVLFSGQDSFGKLFGQEGALALGTLALLMLFKGLAWSISLGNFRGGPTFPAIFLGVVGGLMASHLPGYTESEAVAVLVAVGVAAVLRLPLSAVVISQLLCSKAGLGVAPLVVTGAVVAYVVSVSLSGWFEARWPAELPVSTVTTH